MHQSPTTTRSDEWLAKHRSYTTKRPFSTVFRITRELQTSRTHKDARSILGTLRTAHAGLMRKEASLTVALHAASPGVLTEATSLVATLPLFSGI
jgi:hypothetical protein